MLMESGESHLYLQIAESLRRRIATEELLPGTRLPSVRQTAEQWSCAPDTVARAYSRLSEEGLVVSHTRAGTRVSDAALGSGRDALGWANLVSKADRFLIEMLAAGATCRQTETALTLAVSRWEELQTKSMQLRANSRQTALLRLAGSHDPIAEMLVNAIEAQAPGSIAVEYSGSLGGLLAVAREEADIAAIHLWDRETGTYNAPFVERILPGHTVALLNVAYRTQGLAVAAGNPKVIRGLEDLARSDVRFANRQPGSGTRVWLEHELAILGISTERVVGFDDVRRTHSDVAMAISLGEADTGLVVESAATAFGLDFVPMLREPYELAVPAEMWEHPAVRLLRRILSSTDFQEQVFLMGGYDTSVTGRETWVSGK